MEAIPMFVHRGECSLLLPGAGMNPAAIKPFEKVLKDGYYGVDCVDDFMFTHGDKFGDNKFSYNLGEVSNVSIVHYAMHVAKEDREPMTPDVCFSFCRTVPEMTFFGIRNGRDCYCTPFYRSVEGDDSMCDVVCDGDGTRMCGNKNKSSIFGMHMCSNTQAEMGASATKMGEVETEVTVLMGPVSTVSNGMQSEATAFQKEFGSAGDPVASDLMQTMKVHAGKLAEASKRAQALVDGMAAAQTEATALQSKDFTRSPTVRAAEGVMNKMESLSAEGVAVTEELTNHMVESGPDSTKLKINITGIADEYYPITYFLDKEHLGNPTTCGGTTSHVPLVGSRDMCAHMCNEDVHECVGFSFFANAGSLPDGTGLCSLMSSFKTAVVYTKCDQGSGKKVEAAQVGCMAKFSKYDGTTLQPDRSGKCKQCLKKLTMADRCFRTWAVPSRPVQRPQF